MSCGIYEDYQEGILNETEYLTLRKTYADEVLSLTKEIEGLLQDQAQYDENYRAARFSFRACAPVQRFYRIDP